MEDHTKNILEYTGNKTQDDWSTAFYFQEFVFQWVPCSFLVLTLPLHFISNSKSKKNVFSRFTLYLSKLISSTCLIILYLFQMACRLRKYSDNDFNLSHNLFQPIAMITSEVLATILVTLDRRRGRRNNVLLFIYRLLVEFSLVYIIQSSARCLSYPDDFLEQRYGRHHCCNSKCFVVVMVTFLINTTLLILQSCLSDGRPLSLSMDKKTSPEDSASLFSLLTFAWFSRFVYDAGKTKLGYSDVWSLQEDNKCLHVSNQFHQKWFETDKKRCNSLSSALNGDDVTTTFHNGLSNGTNIAYSTPGEKLLNSESKVIRDQHKCHDPYDPSLVKVLYKMFGGLFVFGVCLNVVHDVLLFASPFIFKQLIGYLMDDKASLSRGMILVVLLLVCSCVQVVLRHQYTFKYNVVGLRVQSALLSAIYKKSLLLDSSSYEGMGEVVNLVSLDAQKVVDMVSMVNYLWSCPIQLAIGTYFLWQLLGPSVLAGLLVTVCMLPVNAWVAKKCKRFQIDQMKFKDARIKLLDEIIDGIKVIKLYAWETIFKGRLSKVRDDELKVIRRAAYLNAAATFAWSSTPFLISLSTFGLYLLSSNENVLTVEKAFVSLTLFNILRMPLSMLPMFVTNVIVAKVSIKRLQRFLTLDEMQEVQRLQKPCSNLPNEPPEPISCAVSLRYSTIGWGRPCDPNVVLSGINLEIPRGSLVAVVGCVGCGKSTLLSAMVEEARLFEGECRIGGSVAYSSQQAWLQNTTVKENILFGNKMDDRKYKKVLECCALVFDLEALPDGDETIVGDRGVTLSGGQKQRVSIARSIYSDADIYMFDDPFASLDVLVANQLFEQVVSNSGIIKDKTRIIATNSISFLPLMDLIIIINDGRISGVGSYRSLLSSNEQFQMFSKNYISNDNNSNNNSRVSQKLSRRKQFTSLSMISRPRSNLLLLNDNLNHCKSCIEMNLNNEHLNGSFSNISLHYVSNLTKSETFIEEGLLESAESVNLKFDSTRESNETSKIVVDEEIRKDKVSYKVLLSYLRSIGLPIGILTFTTFIINNLFSVSTNIWLSKWTDNAGVGNLTHNSDLLKINVTYSDDDTQSHCGLYIYAALGFCYVFALLVRSSLSTLACSRASRVMYSDLIDSLFSVSLTFYDLTPKGRIINRASNDVATLDYVMPFTVSGFFNILIMCLASFGIVSFNIPLFVLPFAILLAVYVLLQRYFMSASQQLRRMSSSLRSYVYSHLGETLQGLSTIRTFGASSRFVRDMFEKVDDMQAVCYLTHVSQRWLGIWLELISILLVSMVALFAVLGRSQMSPGMAALCLTYAFDIIQNLNFLVTMTCELETNLVSIERIKEYSDLDAEDSRKIYPSLPPSWPQDGRLEFQEYSSKYRPDTDLVLKKLSIGINSGEKIGIVGRTGSGKSSIVMSLFRFLNTVEGRILVDGINVMDIPLKNLRSSITLVPQDPVIFSGSIRFNMDPTGICSDEELWNSLAVTSLKNHILELPSHLDHECGSNGSSLRALLRKSKILMLDEATASIDVETEEAIKKCLESKFISNSHEVANGLSDSKISKQNMDSITKGGAEKCTLIMIAHRIRTVLSCDRILLLENGRLEECGEPKVLLANSNSKFYKLYSNCM